jgi:thiosulfate dehydrogenase [quinone] large subunit
MLTFLRKPYLAPVWLVVRVLVGWEWLTAGLEKVSSPAAWFGPQAGAAVAGMVNGAVAQTSGAHPQVLGLAASIAHAVIVPTAPFWGYVIPFAEIIVGLGLILGGLTGTALVGALAMNLVYMLMGSDGVNPVMFVAEAILLAVGPAAVLWGLDHWVFGDWRARHPLLHPVAPEPRPTGDSHAA